MPGVFRRPSRPAPVRRHLLPPSGGGGLPTGVYGSTTYGNCVYAGAGLRPPAAPAAAAPPTRQTPA